MESHHPRQFSVMPMTLHFWWRGEIIGIGRQLLETLSILYHICIYISEYIYVKNLRELAPVNGTMFYLVTSNYQSMLGQEKTNSMPKHYDRYEMLI